jgi:hypothetical protein
MTKEVLKIRKGFLIKVGPQPLPPPTAPPPSLVSPPTVLAPPAAAPPDNEPSAPAADNDNDRVPSAPSSLGGPSTVLARPLPRLTKLESQKEEKIMDKQDEEIDEWMESQEGVDSAEFVKALVARKAARDKQAALDRQAALDKQAALDRRGYADTARKKAEERVAVALRKARIAAKDKLEQKQQETPQTPRQKPVGDRRGRDQTKLSAINKLKAQVAQETGQVPQETGETKHKEATDKEQQPVQPGSFGKEEPAQNAEKKLRAGTAEEQKNEEEQKEENEILFESKGEEEKAVDAAVVKVDRMEQMETQMELHFDLWTTSKEKDRNQQYMIEYNAEDIYGEAAAKAMREMLELTFSNDEWLGESNIDNNTTFAQLRPILVKLFPSCELHDLTDEQLNATVYDEDKHGAVTGLVGISPIKKIQILLRRMLKPDENEPDENGKYEPSKEVLQFNGYEYGYGEGTRLLSFTYVDAGYFVTSSTKRFFNQKLAENFYKIMSVFTDKDKGRVENKEFFIVRVGEVDLIYRINNPDKSSEAFDPEAEVSTLKEAKKNHWIEPLKKLKPAESHYPSPIPAGELSAMLAELSSMGNTSESEYATEEEEFASDSEEFASDDF